MPPNRPSYEELEARLAEAQAALARQDSSEPPVEARSVSSKAAADVEVPRDTGTSLEATERYYRTLLDSIHEDILVIDAQYRIVDINTSALSGLGLTRDAVIGRTCFDVVHDLVEPCTWDGARCPFETVLAEGRPINFHHLQRQKDGTCKHVDVLLSPIKDRAGRVTHVIDAARDVTDLFAAKEALEEREAKLRVILEAAPVGIGVMVDRAFEEVNDCMCEMTGYAREELLGRSARMLYPDDAEFERVGREKYAQIRATGTGRIETRWQRKDGSVIHVILSSTALTPGNLSAGVVFTAQDITARVRAERESQRLTAAITQTSEAVMITDKDARVVYVNPAFERMTGYSTSEVVGHNPRFLRSGEQDAAFYRELWETILAGKNWFGRFVNHRKDGSRYTEECTISPVVDATGEVTNFVAVKRDITEELRIEEQLRQSQKMEAVGQLAGGIAHDLNNILQAIFARVDFALSDLPPTDPSHEDLRGIQEAAERAANLVRQLLAFGRRQMLKLEDLDLNQVIDNALLMLRRVIGEDIEVDFIPGARLGLVHADRTQMEQVLINLCVNARDAMAEGGTMTIETHNVLLNGEYCRTHAWAAPGRYVLLSVSDTGHGMDAETMSRIFDPFFTTKEFGKGTGLGLATVYGIVQQHDGAINVYSEPGHGAVFKIYLPVVARRAIDVERSPTLPARGGAEAILIAEDDPAVRDVAARTLELAGYRVYQATDGREAIEVFERHSDEIVFALLDVVMPRLGGKEVYDYIRRQRPDLRALFTTGYSPSAIHSRFVLAEGMQVIQKPYDRQELLRRVRELLDQPAP